MPGEAVDSSAMMTSDANRQMSSVQRAQGKPMRLNALTESSVLSETPFTKAASRVLALFASGKRIPRVPRVEISVCQTNVRLDVAVIVLFDQRSLLAGAARPAVTLGPNRELRRFVE